MLALIRIITEARRFHVKRTSDKTYLSVLWIDSGRDARETDHGGDGVAMRGLRRDVQGQTRSREVSSAQTFVTADALAGEVSAYRP